MVQPAENWAANNLPGPFDGTRERGILLQGEMRAGAVVICHVRQQQVAEVAFAEHDNVVEAFPSDRTDQPFGISVVKSSQLHSYRLIGRKPSWSRMSFTPSMDVSSGS